MEHLIQDAEGRLVGRLTRSHAGWEVLIYYYKASNHIKGRALKDPEVPDNAGYYPSLSDAKKALDRHIRGLCLIHEYLEKHGTE